MTTRVKTVTELILETDAAGRRHGFLWGAWWGGFAVAVLWLATSVLR